MKKIIILFAISQLFIGCCPTFREFYTEIKHNSTELYIESRIRDAFGFWLYFNGAIQQIDNQSNILYINNRMWEPTEENDNYGIYRLYFSDINKDHNSIIYYTNTEYKIYFSIEAAEGCFSKYALYKFIIKDDDSNKIKRLNEINLSKISIYCTHYELVKENPLLY